MSFNRLGDQGPFRFGDVGVTQGAHDAVAGLALSVAEGLQELEALSGGRAFGAEQARI